MTQVVIDSRESGLRRSGRGGRQIKDQEMPNAARSSDTEGDQILASGWISKKPDRCGGDACIRDMRVPVWVLANYRRLGGSDAEILSDYPFLTMADLEAASAYTAACPEEIDRAIRENEEGEMELAE